MSIKGILHISNDEKFIEAAYFLFDSAFPKRNKFVITTSSTEYKVKFTKGIHNKKIICENDTEQISQLVRSLDNYDYVILHSLSAFNINFIRKTSEIYNGIKFVWILFGIEYYNSNFFSYKNLYAKQTYKTFGFSKNDIKRNINQIVLKIKGVKPDLESIINEIDYFVVYSELEYKSIMDRLRGRAKYIDFSYYPIHKIINPAMSVEGNNILVGNSCAMTNNHLDAFQALKNFSLKSRKVIVPLSYGSNDFIGDIIDNGKKILGDSFKPLTEFMTLSDYHKIIKSCNVFISYTYRQQAVGNILAMLYMGAKVYLSEKNITYKSLMDWGCSVYSIENELIGNKRALDGISEENAKKNREILTTRLNEERIIQSLRKSLS